MSSSNREQRRALLERIDKHDGHWLWTSTHGDRALVLKYEGRRYNARRLAWQLYRQEPLPQRIRMVCDEPRDCLNPTHMTAKEPCRLPGHVADRWRTCIQCREARRSREKWRCDCGAVFRQDYRNRHTCRPAIRQDPAALLVATQDAVRDYQRGMTPERICEAYGVKPDMLAQRLRRRDGRTPIEDELMRALSAYTKRLERP